jgi:S-adenosylmethionine/arginine decarboxylase-like enzyme
VAKHLKILGKGNPSLLADEQYVAGFIKSCIEIVGMRPLDEPKLINVPLQIEKLKCELFEDEGGITGQLVGFCTLSTSHIAVHTWPLRNEFHMDLYSCREFDADELVKFVMITFQVGVSKISDLSEACEW